MNQKRLLEARNREAWSKSCLERAEAKVVEATKRAYNLRKKYEDRKAGRERVEAALAQQESRG